MDFINTDIECLRLIHKHTGARVEPDSFIDRAIHHIISFHKLVDLGKVNPLTLHHYRLSNTFREFGISWSEGYVDRYKRILLERATPYPNVHNVLSYLNGKVKLGILTNAYDPVMQTGRIQASGLAGFFEQVQISGEEIYAKPDPKAFHLISNRLGTIPEECIFIGDSPRYVIDGAISAGMMAILIQRETAAPMGNPDISVKSIKELGSILKKLIA